MTTLLTRFKSFLDRQELTVCEELNRTGYVKNSELVREGRYNRDNVPFGVCFTYKLVIIPVVILMKLVPSINPLMNWIARRVWLDRALS